MEYTPQVPLDMSSVPQSGDPTTNMSPMDLFDSIFWGKFSPFSLI